MGIVSLKGCAPSQKLKIQLITNTFDNKAQDQNVTPLEIVK
jgi:hypothetical protein